jgi:hypothetical protein
VDDGNDNDDFAQLEGVASSRADDRVGSSLSVDGVGIDGGVDADYHSQYGVGGGGAGIMGGGGGGVPQMENRPLLSPTAESALLSLCTNFLLYVAMVLITVMVARLYFPSWLEPREEPISRVSSAHMYMNVSDNIDGGSYSDEDDDGKDEEEDFIEAGNGAGGKVRRENNDRGGYKDEVDLLDLDGGNAPRDGPPPPPLTARRMRVVSSFLDYDQETMTRESVYTNLAICAIMLNVTFVSWGLLQVT